jgi:putative transposase
MSLATPIPLGRLCQLAGVSRPGYYRWLEAPPALDRDLDLRDEIQRIALDPPQLWVAADHRRAETPWLGRQSQAVYCIMREDNLLCLRRRKFVVTTQSAGIPLSMASSYPHQRLFQQVWANLRC